MTGYIYFLAIADDGPIKIGTSRHVSRRIASLQCAIPYDLLLLGVMASDRPLEEEQEIHTRLSAARIRGEWFEREAAKSEIEKHRRRFIDIERTNDHDNSLVLIQSRIRERLYQKLVARAKRDNRSIANCVEQLLFERLEVD